MFFLLEQRPGQRAAIIQGTKYDNGMVAIANPPELRARQQFISSHYVRALPDSDGPARWIDDAEFTAIRNRLAGITDPDRVPSPSLATAAAVPGPAQTAPAPAAPAAAVSPAVQVVSGVPDPSTNEAPAPILASKVAQGGESRPSPETLPAAAQPTAAAPSPTPAT